MSRASNEYSEAIFKLACEQEKCEEYLQAIKEIADLFDGEPEYVDFLAAPGIPRDERTAALSQVLSGYPEDVVSFACLLCERGRIRELRECADTFEEMYLELRRISRAVVTSAVELTDEQTERLRHSLEAKCGHTVALTVTVDPTLIGGMTVEMDGKVIDGSMKRRLHHMKEVIAK